MYKCQYRATFSPIFSKINVIDIKLRMCSINSATKLQTLYFRTKNKKTKKLKIGEKWPDIGIYTYYCSWLVLHVAVNHLL